MEMPFGLRTRVGPGNHELDGGPDLPMGRGNFEWGKERPIVKYRDTLRAICAKMAKPIDFPFALWTREGPRKRKLNRIRQVAPMYHHRGHIGATWLIRFNRPSAAAMRPYVKLP